MKSISYAIVSSTAFALGCFAPAYVDRVVMTAIGVFCLIALTTQDQTP